jgi:hypothetical protein
MDSVFESMLCVLLVGLSVGLRAIKLGTKSVHRHENYFINY